MGKAYGPKPPLEEVEQAHFFQWAEYQSGSCPKLVRMFHIPNGGLRNKAVAAKLKAQGVKAGVPDICLPVVRGGYSGLYIEMKRKGEKPSAEQELYIADLREEGYRVEVCEGCEAAILVVCEYMGIKPPVMGGVRI